MVNKLRPRAMIRECHDADGRSTWREIYYFCPLCDRAISGYKEETACDICGTFYDWGVREPRIKTTYTVEW